GRRLSWGVPICVILGTLTIARGYLLWSNVITIIALAIMVQFTTINQQKKWLAIPALTVAIMLVVKTSFLLFNEFTLYREMVVLFEALITGILAFVFLVVKQISMEHKQLQDFNFEDCTAFVIMGAGLIIGLSDINLFGLSLTGIACRLGILMAAILWGTGAGTIVGVASGILPSLNSISMPRMVLIYAVSGLLAGLFRGFGRLGSVVGFILGSVLLSVFMTSSHQALLGLWESGIAIGLFFLIPERIKEMVLTESKEPGSNMDTHVKEMTAERMNQLAKVFEEISMTFAGGEQPAESPAEPNAVGKVFQNITEGFCQKCGSYETCWEREFYKTYREFFNLFSIAELKGSLDYDEVASEVRKRCIRPRELVTAINGVLESARVSEYWEVKINESKDLLSHQMKGISGLIRKLAGEINLDLMVDKELQANLTRECREMMIPIREITPITGGNDLVFMKVTADACMDRETCDVMLAPCISTVMGTRYEVSQRQCPRSSRGKCEFVLARAFNYRINTGIAQLAKADVSGDSFNVVTLKDGRELIVLSDGMGIGKRAAQESKATVNLLEELLNTGFGEELALQTINSVLLLRNNQDSFATVDLAMINLYSGEVEFVKIGASPSFLKRGSRIGVISANSLPIGVLEDLEIPSEKRNLVPGDMLVIVSDGVLEPDKTVGEREAWLQRLLSQTREEDPHRLAEIIINHSLNMARGKPRDDMTVICARVEVN
ncbi:MAG: stage II sporulation protein E, partial [Chitinophagales bacterium]